MRPDERVIFPSAFSTDHVPARFSPVSPHQLHPLGERIRHRYCVIHAEIGRGEGAQEAEYHTATTGEREREKESSAGRASASGSARNKTRPPSLAPQLLLPCRARRSAGPHLEQLRVVILPNVLKGGQCPVRRPVGADVDGGGGAARRRRRRATRRGKCGGGGGGLARRGGAGEGRRAQGRAAEGGRHRERACAACAGGRAGVLRERGGEGECGESVVRALHLLLLLLLLLLHFHRSEAEEKKLRLFVTPPSRKQPHGPPGPRALGAIPGRPQRQVQRRGLRRAPRCRRRSREAARRKSKCGVGCDECRPSSPRRSPHGVFFRQA